MLTELQGKGSPHLCKPSKLAPISKRDLAAVMAVPQPRAEQVGGQGKDSPVGCHLPANPLLLSEGLKLNLPVHTRKVCSPGSQSEQIQGSISFGVQSCGALQAPCPGHSAQQFLRQRGSSEHSNKPRMPENQELQQETAKQSHHPSVTTPSTLQGSSAHSHLIRRSRQHI